MDGGAFVVGANMGRPVEGTSLERLEDEEGAGGGGREVAVLFLIFKGAGTALAKVNMDEGE